MTHSEQTRRRIADRRKGQTHSAETKAKIRAALLAHWERVRAAKEGK